MISPVFKSFFLPIFRRHKKIFFLLGIEGLISGAVAVVLPVFAKLETDQLIEKHSFEHFGIQLTPFNLFIGILGLILIVNIIEKLIESVIRIVMDSYQNYIANDIQLTLFRNMEKMEVGRTMSSRFRYIASIIDNEFDASSRQILEMPGGILKKLVTLVGMVSIYVYFDIRLLAVVVISAAIGYYIGFFAQRIRTKYEIKWKFSLGRKQFFYSSLFLRNFIDLATNGAVGSMIRQYDFILGEEVKNGLQKNWADLSWSIASLINDSISQIAIKAIVGYGVFVGTNSVGMVVLVIASMGTVDGLVTSLFEMRKNYRDFRFRESSIELFLEICAPVGTIDCLEPKPLEISMENLSFSYPNLARYELDYLGLVQKRLQMGSSGNSWMDENLQNLVSETEEAIRATPPVVLKDLSLRFEKGKIYGIVGRNGSGKTTLMHLLAGFFRSYGGTIRFGGDDMRNWVPNLCSGKVSFLTQMPYTMNYSATVRENILFGVDAPTDDSQIWSYLETFGIAEKIHAHKLWLEAMLGDDIEFSGGEKQILAFIRILLQDRPVVILDEGTNQLDAENELLVMTELLKRKDGKIIIFITHRMSTVSRADLIHCIENGAVSASGTHSALLKDGNNPYARFYRAQILHREE